MNRFLLTSLVTIAFTIIVPSVSQANPIFYNSNTICQTLVRQIAPSDLVIMARRGQLKTQGIPGAMQLTSEYVLGRIDAEKIVQAAIAACLLPTDAVNDLSYLSAVASQLQIRLRLY
ncbi:MAG: hypothetical protein QNJ72_30590 [Pleurocapsa sp. MO_226.B13]|nr:hypothetical protein [Pleurocapsa sp. MO_226.B13]